MPSGECSDCCSHRACPAHRGAAHRLLGSQRAWYDDVDLAHAVWLSSDIANYTYEVALDSSWFPRSGYYQVVVADGSVIAVTDENGDPVQRYDLAIDVLWEHILYARETASCIEHGSTAGVCRSM